MITELNKHLFSPYGTMLYLCLIFCLEKQTPLWM